MPRWILYSTVESIPMLIDQALPTYDFHEIHSLEINAPAEKIYEALWTLDLSRSLTTRLLFVLRGMPSSCLTLQGLIDIGFRILAEHRPQELVIGVIGKFWTFYGGLVQFEPSTFAQFHVPAYAKAAWNFSLSEIQHRTTLVTTQTRIVCTDERSRQYFRYYWLIVRPFSGLIRKEILHTLKREAERQK
ncbi:MAG: hypothetical protein ACRDGA_12845 [Bacteroidota bacterium]